MSNKRSSITFFGALFILFLGLKLGNVIDWSWWWVAAPLWAPFAVVGGLLLLLAVCVEALEK